MQQSSGSIGSLAAALARAQVELIDPEKSMVASIRPNDASAEQIFRYAPLSSGLDIVQTTWWRDRGIDVLGVARMLWLEFHPQVPMSVKVIV